MFTRPRATIDLNAIVSNWRALHELTNGGEVAAVVKANAYGHGAEQVSTALLHAGCHRFFVATIDEAVELRAFLGRGPQILILDGVFDPDLPLAARHQLTPVLNSMLQVKAWASSPASDGHAAVIHIDTGMKRLGVPPSECAAAKSALDSKSVGIVMSHLACADEPDNPLNVAQRETFLDCATMWPDALRSLSNSAGLAFDGGAYAFDIARPGIALYGGGVALPTRPPLLAALTLEAPIVAVFEAKPGDSTGYGATHQFDTARRLATVAIGYADGLPRALSNSGHAAIEGQRCPIVGRISMDLLTLDVTDVSCMVAPGTAVEFFGSNVDLEAQAAAADTLGYELLTGIGPRVERVWHG